MTCTHMRCCTSSSHTQLLAQAKQKLAAHRDGPAEEGLRGKDLHQPKQNGSRPHSGYNAELKNSRQSEMLTSRSRMLDDEAIPSDALHMV